MSFLLPPAALERSAAASETSAAVGQTGSAAPRAVSSATAVVSDLPSSRGLASPVTFGMRRESIVELVDAATGALAHLLGGMQPGAPVSVAGPAGSSGQGRDGVLRVSLPLGSLMRHAYNPMQAAKSAQAPNSSRCI